MSLKYEPLSEPIRSFLLFCVNRVASEYHARVYFTQFIDQIISESQLPQKPVKSLFWLGIVNSKLTILCGS